MSIQNPWFEKPQFLQENRHDQAMRLLVSRHLVSSQSSFLVPLQANHKTNLAG
jgi:hypothetical protein